MAFIQPAEIVKRFALQEGQKFLDVGAGSGAYALLAAQAVGNSGIVYAVDVQKDLLLKLKQLAADAEVDNITYLWADIERPGATQIQEGTIDVALLSNVLFQLIDKHAALTEIYKLLKPSGVLFIIDWADSYNGLGPDSERVVDAKRAKSYAEGAKFTVVESFGAGDHHYGLQCKKS